jgi:hypothetical protein
MTIVEAFVANADFWPMATAKNVALAKAQANI